MLRNFTYYIFVIILIIVVNNANVYSSDLSLLNNNGTINEYVNPEKTNSSSNFGNNEYSKEDSNNIPETFTIGSKNLNETEADDDDDNIFIIEYDDTNHDKTTRSRNETTSWDNNGIITSMPDETTTPSSNKITSISDETTRSADETTTFSYNEITSIPDKTTTPSSNNVTNKEQNEQLKNTTQQRPHIIFILGDDMVCFARDIGWNDFSFHGSGEYMTPNIDALAYNGIQLHRMYAMHVCTPSRAALMTGYHPIHTGMQHKVIYGEEPRGLPLHLKILPQYMNDLGYDSHIVGKWHLGWWKKVYTPLYRGFKSHLGFWTGHHHYFDHWAREWNIGGLDMRRNMDPAWDLTGKYTTDIITEKSVEIIENHDQTKPLFLYIAHAACHSSDPNDTMPVPSDVEKKFSYIKDIRRRKYATTAWILDESVGKVVKALGDKKMLENSVIVFSSDNGGAAAGFNLNMASNWPLKGVKNTLWEGGTRVAALIWSPLIKKQQRLAHQFMHFSDWLPTLYHAAGGNVTDLGDIDGINIWPALSNDTESPRTEILHNIDDDFKNAALTVDQWKIMAGTMYTGQWDNWYGPSGRNDTKHDFNTVRESLAGKSLRSIGYDVSIEKMKILRNEAEIMPNNVSMKSNCNLLKEICLFNIIDDPCETVNLAPIYPEIVEKMLIRLEQIRKTAVPPNNQPLDKRGDPKNFDYVWTNFGDYISDTGKNVFYMDNKNKDDEEPMVFRKVTRKKQNVNNTDMNKITYYNKTYMPTVVSMNQKVHPTIMSTSYEEEDLNGRRYLDIPIYDENIDESEVHKFESKMKVINKR